MNSFIFIHSVMNEIDKNIPLIVCGFTGNASGETHIVFFQKRRSKSSVFEILRVVSLLGEKFIFFSTSQGKKFQEFKALCEYSCRPSHKRPSTTELCFYFKCFDFKI